MQKHRVVTWAALGIPALFLAAVAGFSQTEQTFNGEIMDSNCAKMGSHAAMEKEHGIKNAEACTMGCVKEAFAGQKVRVTGKLDAATSTIHVQDIKP